MGKGRISKLTAEAQKTIVEYIGRGAFEHVAAEAAGITRQSFWNWMRRGERSNKPGPFRELFDEVSKARAQARLIAEGKVFENAPFNWLRYGPGRERPGEPGWTDSHEITGPGGGAVQLDVTLLTDEELETLDRFVAKAGRKPRGDPPRVRPPA